MELVPKLTLPIETLWMFGTAELLTDYKGQLAPQCFKINRLRSACIKFLALVLFQNDAWSTLGQLNGGCGEFLPFPLVSLAFEYLPLTQVYTFFRWKL